MLNATYGTGIKKAREKIPSQLVLVVDFIFIDFS